MSAASRAAMPRRCGETQRGPAEAGEHQGGALAG
eukprot:CAMPEP_0180285896 /NCGR_PEP_ID=MMETSP0988-20121125/12222_1 /TAXON_ID=697907 /ORGANISM="non described non described, Strain CCMP2293" /LENGTH=33 /DNA_ID= /DNA_START= /DNA_END= /DNA_ORIENTATION=